MQLWRACTHAPWSSLERNTRERILSSTPPRSAPFIGVRRTGSSVIPPSVAPSPPNHAPRCGGSAAKNDLFRRVGRLQHTTHKLSAERELPVLLIPPPKNKSSARQLKPRGTRQNPGVAPQTPVLKAPAPDVDFLPGFPWDQTQIKPHVARSR